jgi:xanthine dehydrogenase molybdenum-binding subunit
MQTSPEISIELEEVLKEAVVKNWGTAMGTASVRAPACPPHFIVNFVEVEVDTMTGKVRLVDAYCGADVGTPLYPEGVKGQVIGGFHMGAGYALTENTIIDPESGVILNAGYRDYKILPPLDMPYVDLHLADTYEPTGPFGAKGAGEGATNPVAPAVANAIYNAIGVRFTETPITPEKILMALNKI